MVKLFQGATKHWRYVLTFALLGLAFWMIEFLYQYYILIPGSLQSSLIRSFSLTGATLIGIALLIGPIAKLFPSKNYIKERRAFGVLGFTFIILHVIAVMNYLYGFNIPLLVADKNPYANPALFGAIAFIIYIPLFLTSTDWANEKLGYYKWKFIHRFVYMAWILSVLHFIQVNPPLLLNPAGYLLLAVSALVFMSELAAFAKHVKTNRGINMLIGILLILAGGILFYFAYQNENSHIATKNIIAYGIPLVLSGAVSLYIISQFIERRHVIE